MASTILSRTQGTPTNADKWTFSVWVKSSNPDELNEGKIMGTYVDANNYVSLGFQSEKKISYYAHGGGAEVGQLKTNRRIKDPAAWYHFVFVWDTAASATDRMRIYVNGVEETSFATDTNPALNLDSLVNTSGNVINIGTNNPSAASSQFFQGVMAHIHFCDGQAYAASDFGSTDATSGIWIPNTGPSVTYGNNGFFLKMASGALGTDSSGNGNTMAVTGTMTNTKDTPNNNFATLNPGDNYYPASTFSNGNNTVVTAGAVYAPNISTVGMSGGKWYWEFKTTARVAGANMLLGITSTQATAAAQEIGNFANDWAVDAYDGALRNNNSDTSYGVSWDTEVMAVALDLTNNKLYFAKDNVWMDSGVPTSGATGTGAISITAPASTPLGAYFAGASYHTSGGATFSYNFGNGYFGTTAVTSAEADGNGEGQFEYAPPTGYFALCTNNLGSDS